VSVWGWLLGTLAGVSMPSLCADVDIQLVLPAILTALLIELRAAFCRRRCNKTYGLLLTCNRAVVLVNFARSALRPCADEQGVRAGGCDARPAPLRIMFVHIPPILGPLLVMTVDLASANFT
jgi:hypothetical protein